MKLFALCSFLFVSLISMGQWSATLYSGWMPNIPLEAVYEIEIESDGDVWAVNWNQLVHFDGSNWTVFDGSNTTVPMSYYNRLVSIGNDLWISTPADGLFKMDFSGTAVQYNTTNSGLLNDSIVDLEKNSLNQLVIKTTDGLMVFDGGTTWLTIDISTLDECNQIAVDGSDHIWCTQPEGPAEYTGSTWTIHDTVGACPNSSNYLLSGGPQGAAFSDGQEITLYNGSSWSSYPNPNVSWITSILLDSSGDLWANSTDGNLPENASLHHFDGISWSGVSSASNLYEPEYWAGNLTESPFGSIWSSLNKDLIETYPDPSAGMNDNHELNSIRVYPNPVRGTLFIQVENKTFVAFHLIDLNGKVWQSEENRNGLFQVELDDVTSGLYIVELQHKSGGFSRTKVQIEP